MALSLKPSLAQEAGPCSVSVGWTPVVQAFFRPCLGRMALHEEEVSTVETEWCLAAGKVRGPSHIRTGTPNQDDYEIRTSSDGRVVAVVVSDGAGSAESSREGARTCVRIMSRQLLDIGQNKQEAIARVLAHDVEAREDLLAHVVGGLEQVRQSLENIGGELRQYAHTFTGLVMTPRGGLIVQIGDSPAVLAGAREVVGPDGEKEVDFFADHRILLPAGGEYANETHFVTQSDWRARLSPNAIPPGRFGAILLMSDGAGALAIHRKRIFRPFINALVGRLLEAKERRERDAIISEVLNDPRCDEATGDDKTLVVMYPKRWDVFAGTPPFVKQELITPALPERQLFRYESDSDPRGGISAMSRRGAGKFRIVVLLAVGLLLGGLLSLVVPVTW